MGDELDMRFGPGDSPAVGLDPRSPTATCPTSNCGYTVLDQLLNSTPKDGGLRYANFGKGVLFWETDGQARRFVNKVNGVTSADAYWYTDRNLCQASEGGKLRQTSKPLERDDCQIAFNYDLTVQRVRSLVAPTRSHPVWAFVELGHPFSQDDWPSISGGQIRAAAWASIIGGARGIVYFNNSFGGACPTADVLGSECGASAEEAVSRANREIEQLAPVINSPAVMGFVKHSSSVHSTVRLHEGSLYIFAVNKSDREHRVRFSLPCSTTPERAQVLFEGRSVRLEGAVLRDEFQDGDSVHIYKIEDLGGCGRVTND